VHSGGRRHDPRGAPGPSDAPRRRRPATAAASRRVATTVPAAAGCVAMAARAAVVRDTEVVGPAGMVRGAAVVRPVALAGHTTGDPQAGRPRRASRIVGAAPTATRDRSTVGPGRSRRPATRNRRTARESRTHSPSPGSPRVRIVSVSISDRNPPYRSNRPIADSSGRGSDRIFFPPQHVNRARPGQRVRHGHPGAAVHSLCTKLRTRRVRPSTVLSRGPSTGPFESRPSPFVRLPLDGLRSP
jgi:hypothetical protein